MKKTFNGKRLKIARTYRAKTVDQLAAETKINKKDIQAFEDNKYLPTPENTMKLVNALSFPKDYFFQNELVKVTVEGSHFNPDSKLKRVEEIAFREKIVMTHKIFNFMEGYIKFPESNLPTNIKYKNNVDELAENVRRFWNLGDGPIGNMTSLLEANGILISQMNVNIKGASPITQKQSIDRVSRYLIALGNDKKSATIRNYDLAYELSYIVSNELNISLKHFPKEEFACAFLLPKESFIKDLDKNDDLEYYVELKKKWIVPISVMVFRAYQLGVLSYKKYNFLMQEMNKKGWLNKEPLDENIKATAPTCLKSGLELLFDEKMIAKENLLDKLAERTITIHSSDVEELTGIKQGILKSNKKENSKVISFKK